MQSPFLQPAGKAGKAFRLAEGFATAECDAVQQRIFVNLPQDGFQRCQLAPLEIMGAFIMATGTFVRASLGENRKTEPRAIDDGFPHHARQAQIETIFHYNAS